MSQAGADPLEGAVRLEDLEALARERMPLPAFDYYAGGSGDEWTLAENRRAFDRWILRPRYLVDVSNIDLGTTVLGQSMPLPILLAPSAVYFLHETLRLFEWGVLLLSTLGAALISVSNISFIPPR